MRSITRNVVVRTVDDAFNVRTLADVNERISFSQLVCAVAELARSDAHFDVDALGDEIVLRVYLWETSD
nr:MAG TPA: hypothetical protein [Caudoviricetes sp.]